MRSDCLPGLLRQQAGRRPDAIAVVAGNERLTFAELAGRSAELAGRLHHLGVSADDCVGLFVEPSVDLMVGVWGILCAGGAYLPLSPEYPDERLRYMIEDSGTMVVLAQPALTARLAALAPADTTILTLQDAEGFVPDDIDPAPEDLAYVIYTSGTTGKPKGVMIEHRSIVSQMRWLAAEQGLSSEKTVLQKTPMSFDAAQWEILAPACGATVVMGAPGIYRDPERLLETIIAHDVTTLQCVPTLLQALLDTEEMPSCKSLRQVFAGGEVLPKPLAQAFLAAMPGCELVNLYGPTECTINASAYTVDPATVADGPNAISIGAPVHDTRYLILDDAGAEVPGGEIGELYIGGVQVARGYLHRPELTAQRFVPGPGGLRLFRTGDLASWNADGTVQFAGRADNQVKLRGYRVELDEIRLAIETHDWVRHAAVIVKTDQHTGYQNLVACVELNPREAALMDQGNHGAHHQSKQSKVQVRAQLSNAGLREATQLTGRFSADLPGRVATPAQRQAAFERKSYRFYEGGEVTAGDVLRLLGRLRDRRAAAVPPRGPDGLSFAELGRILRYLGPHISAERLLPKYGYASPGSLYATQLYLEINGVGGLLPGIYYFHPVEHRLVRITATPGAAPARARLHFVGKRAAIEPVYKNNIQEVLEIETGHMVALLEEVLPGYGLDIVEAPFDPAAKAGLDVAAEDYYLGAFDWVPFAGPRPFDMLDVYVQAHPGRVAGLPAGQYTYDDGRLVPISDELIQRKHVIAINQAVYDRASIGITAVSRTGPAWRRYIDLGRALQRLSMNDLDLGFMSSGYSSHTGDDLPSARRIDAILRGLGRPTGPSYFFIGGRVSHEQRRHEGMNEDVVHMRGPAEMIRDDLIDFLPHYMIPNKVVILDALPTTANGKIDVRALAASAVTDVDRNDRPFVAPRTHAERRIAELWQQAMKRDSVSVLDDFFASGGNSLIAVGLVNRLNREFQAELPLQVLFEAPTIDQLARRLERADTEPLSRLVPLQPEGPGRPIFCWPGLGGYPMNLRLLAERMGRQRPFFGVQTHGINAGELPYPTIREMAAADAEIIKRAQPDGPITLWGYSFGARVAFETAYQLEQAGRRVDQVVLIAPGAPKVGDDDRTDHVADYTDPTYVTILFSVFTGTITGPLLQRFLAAAHDDEHLAEFLSTHLAHLEPDLVHRIIRVVRTTFEFSYSFRELAERCIAAPITIFKAQGDDYSFLDGSSGYSSTAPAVVPLRADHYALLRPAGIDELVTAIRRRTGIGEANIMPHVNIKYFPVVLSDEQQSELITAVTAAVTNAFGCDEGVVSIAFDPVEEADWKDTVYIPEIINRRDILGKVPTYSLDHQ